MAVSATKRAAIVVLVTLAIYMLLFHADPWPANHEAIGLGKLHVAHSVIGIVLLIAAVYIWYLARRKPAGAPTE